MRSFLDGRGPGAQESHLTAEDIREGIVCVLSIYRTTRVSGADKERLGNPRCRPWWTTHPAGAGTFLHQNRTAGTAIVERISLAAKAREASPRGLAGGVAQDAISHRLNLPGKLADCSSTDPARSELFIVEGDSAGGSAKQGRERKYQAILPLRGKVLNAEQASLQRSCQTKSCKTWFLRSAAAWASSSTWSACATTRSSS